MKNLDCPRPRMARSSCDAFSGRTPGGWETVPSAYSGRTEAGAEKSAGGNAVEANNRNLSCPDCDLAFGRHLHLHLPPAPAEVSRIRRDVRLTLFSWVCPPQVIDDSVLLASELVGNAVKYGAAALITVNLLQVGDRLLLEVTDVSSARPAVRHSCPDDEQGRGMFLVQEIASAWGVRQDSYNTKTTWCTIALDGCGAPPSY